MFGDRSLLPGPGESPSGEEVVAERTATTRTFETDIPGLWLTQQFAAPVNVAVGEVFEPIDPSLEPSSDGFANTLDSVEVTVADVADAASLGSLELPSGASAAFSLDGAAPSAAVVDGSVATYADALEGVDLELESVPGGIKETLVLASSDAPTEFTFDLDLYGLVARTAADGGLVFETAAGVAKVTIPPGFMVDAVGVRSEAVSTALSPDGTRLVVTVDPTWLADPARVFPVEVDPSLSVVADADDTYVTHGLAPPGVDQSSSPELQVGFDGSTAHRSFLHFTGPSTMAGMNVLAADLSLWQSGSGSCSATPTDVYAVTQAWVGASTTQWPGPTTAATPAATMSSGKGHDATCAAGAVGVDLTRQVDAWVQGDVASLGIGLRARDEADANQHKTFTSADGALGQRPVINVLWSDPTQAGAPFEPTDLAPEDHTASFEPTLSSYYYDPDGDAGYVVYFGYFADTGAFAGAVLSPLVDSGETATATGYLPLDLSLTWRAQAVDDAHELPSRLTPHLPIVHPSARVTAPVEGDLLEGYATLTAEVDPSITDANQVEFLVDGSVVATATDDPWVATVSTDVIADGDHDLTARIVGGASDDTPSLPVPVVSDDGSGPPPEGQPPGRWFAGCSA